MSTTACTDAETSIFVRHNIIPELGETGCSYSPDPAGGGLLAGSMNFALATDYTTALSVGNQLVPRGDDDTLKPESNRVQFYEVEVEVFDFAGLLLGEFSVPATGFADPSGGANPGYGAVSATLIDPAVADRFVNGEVPQTVVARVIVHGITLGGTEVESAPWDYPIKMFSSTACELKPCDEDLEANFCSLGNDHGLVDCRFVSGQCIEV